MTLLSGIDIRNSVEPNTSNQKSFIYLIKSTLREDCFLHLYFLMRGFISFGPRPPDEAGRSKVRLEKKRDRIKFVILNSPDEKYYLK